jgi:hypothetical protein
LQQNTLKQQLEQQLGVHFQQDKLQWNPSLTLSTLHEQQRPKEPETQ